MSGKTFPKLSSILPYSAKIESYIEMKNNDARPFAFISQKKRRPEHRMKDEENTLREMASEADPETAGGEASGAKWGEGEGPVLPLAPNTITISFCPCWHRPGAPPMKKKAPDRSNRKTDRFSSSFWIGLDVLHDL